MKIKVSKELKNISDKLNGKLYIVGGYVRNSLLGYPKTDVDLTGELLPSEVDSLLKGSFDVILDYASFGSVLIVGKKEKYEYTTFRSDSYVKGEHRPTEVSFTKDIKIDAFRRDFTVNALYYHIDSKKLIDGTGRGLSDLKDKVLFPCAGERTFSEDGLRIMRLVRISAELGFFLSIEASVLALTNAELLLDIKKERIRDEFLKILYCDKKYPFSEKESLLTALWNLYELDVFKYIMPEILKGDKFKQNEEYHKFDVLEHIFQTVYSAEPEVRLASFFHDIGKPEAKNEDGKFYRHPEISARIAKKVLGEEGFRLKKSEVDRTVRLVEHHMKDLDGSMKERKLRLFFLDNHDIIEDLIKLKIADGKGCGYPYSPSSTIFKWIKLFEEMKKTVPFELSGLKIDGKEVLEQIGEENKKYTGRVLKKLLEKVATCDIKNEKYVLMENIDSVFREVLNG